MSAVRMGARALAALARRAAQVRATRPAAVNALKQVASNRATTRTSSRITNRAARTVTPASTPMRNGSGVRKAVPPKTSKIIRTQNHQTGQVGFARTPNTAAARTRQTRQSTMSSMQAQKPMTPADKAKAAAAKPKPGARLGGDPAETGARHHTKIKDYNVDTNKLKKPASGTIQSRRGAQADDRAANQGQRGVGGVPAAARSRPSSPSTPKYPKAQMQRLSNGEWVDMNTAEGIKRSQQHHEALRKYLNRGY